MAALVRSQIPADIDTFEKMITYCAMALQDATNGQSVNVIAGEQQQPMAACNRAVLADGVNRFCIQVYIPWDGVIGTNGTSKPWMAAKAIVTAAPNPNFFAN
jgi:hypothetical protein